MMSPADYIAQLECVVREQMAEMDQLRATISRKDAELDTLVDWIRGDAGALEALQAVYADPRQSPANVIKSASAAVAYERAKPPSAAIVANFNLYEALERPKPMTIEHQGSLASDRGGEALTGPDEPAA
jgi:hypothetical protein